MRRLLVGATPLLMLATALAQDLRVGPPPSWTMNDGRLANPAAGIELGDDRVPAIADDPPSQVELYVTGVAHLPGLNQTRWRSSLEVCNFGFTPRDVGLELLLRGQANPAPPTVAFQLLTGACARFNDVVPSLFGLQDVAGAIRIRASGDGIFALAHTANETPDGTYGSGLAVRSAVDAVAAGQSAVLIHLSESAAPDEGFRTNLDLLNLTGLETTVEIALHRASDTLLGTLTTSLLPSEYDQLTRVFREVTAGEVADGYAVVRTLTEGGAVLASASLVDNRSGDVVTIPAMGLADTVLPTEEDVTLVNDDGFHLAATLFRTDGSGMGVLLAHSGVPGQSQVGLHPIARELAVRGYTVLTFDFRGYGRTGGAPAYGRVDVDVRAGIDYLRSLGVARIAAMGVGLGAIGCAKCGREPDLVGLALISCPLTVSPPLLEITLADMSPLRYPKLIIAAEDDYANGRPFAEYARTIYGYSTQPKTLVVYPGAYHSMQLFQSEHGDDLHDLLMGFFEDLG